MSILWGCGPGVVSGTKSSRPERSAFSVVPPAALRRASSESLPVRG